MPATDRKLRRIDQPLETRRQRTTGAIAIPGGVTGTIGTPPPVGVTEGPGIDLLDGRLGVAGDSILLFDANQAPAREFAWSAAGLAAALAAAAPGDTVVLFGAGTIAFDSFTAGAELSTAAINVRASLGEPVPGLTQGELTIGQWYAVEAFNGGVDTWPGTSSGANSYAFNLSNDDGATWSGPLGQHYGVEYSDAPGWVAATETVNTFYRRVFFQATTTRIRMRVYDTGNWNDNTGSLSWRLRAATATVVPAGVSLLGLGRTTVIDGSLSVAGWIGGQLTVTGSVSATGAGEYTYSTPAGLTVTNRAIRVEVAGGTAPLQTTSTTLVANLNADLLDGLDATAFQPIDADLTAIAALTTTTFGRSLLTLANAAALRAAGELGTAALAASTDFVSATANRAANTFFAGPVSGSAAPATFRAASAPRRFGWGASGTPTTGVVTTPIYTADVALTLTGVTIYADTAPSGGALDVDIERWNGSSWATVFSVRPTVAAGQNSGGGGATLSTTAIAAGQRLRVNVIAVNGAANLTIELSATVGVI